MFEQVVWGAKVYELRLYYLLVLGILLYLCYKHRRNGFFVLIILLFFPGVFAYAGKGALNAYRIVITGLSVYWFLKLNPLKGLDIVFTGLSFLFFTFTFLITSYINKDYLTIIFSQYSRFLIFFIFFLILTKYQYDPAFRESTSDLVGKLITIQIFLAITKFGIMGLTESVVGSISFDGGGTATTLPVLGYMFYWIRKEGTFNRMDWLYTIGLMFIGFVSLKRAIWFIMPVFITLFPPRRQSSRGFSVLSLLAIPLVFYFGIRLNPTLNEEGKVWGSFDLNFALEFAENYAFGEEDLIEPQAKGRGSATLMVFDKFTKGNLTDDDLWGHGLRYMYGSSYIEFAEFGFGLNHKGSATGLFQTLITNGFFGILAYLMFIIMVLSQTKNFRLRWILIIFFLWDYTLYSGLLIREPALSFLLVYIVVMTTSTSNLEIPGLSNGSPPQET